MEINVRQINNTADNKTMTLCSEWSDNQVKLIIIRDGNIPLRRIILIEDLEMFADNFEVTKEDYFSEIKKELINDNKDVKYHLIGKKFKWKKKAWTRGEFEVELIDDIIQFSQLMLHILPRLIPVKNNIINLNEENGMLKNKLSEREKINEEMIKMKKSMEEDLCIKFLVLLNTKKKRIKKLEEKLSEYEKEKIYEAPTDMSDAETPEENKPGPSKLQRLDSVDLVSVGRDSSNSWLRVKQFNNNNTSNSSRMDSLLRTSDLDRVLDSSDEEFPKRYPKKKSLFISNSRNGRVSVETSFRSVDGNDSSQKSLKPRKEVTILTNPMSKKEVKKEEKKEEKKTDVNHNSHSLFNLFTNLLTKEAEGTLDPVEEDKKDKSIVEKESKEILEESEDDYQLKMEEDSDEDFFS